MGSVGRNVELFRHLLVRVSVSRQSSHGYLSVGQCAEPSFGTINL